MVLIYEHRAEVVLAAKLVETVATALIVMAAALAVMAEQGLEPAAAVPGGIQVLAAGAEVVTLNMLVITVLAAAVAVGTLAGKMAAVAVELVFLAKVVAV